MIGALYVNSHYSIKEIANMYNISTTTLRNAHNYYIKTRKIR